jgi:hypothetical protein
LKDGSAHDAGGGVALGGSWSASINAHWPEASAATENVRCEDYLAAKNHSDLEASSSRRLSISENRAKKGKEVTRDGSSKGGAWCHTTTSQWALQWGLALSKSHSRASTKDKARRILLDSEEGAFGDLPPWVRNSFLKGWYSPLTGMNVDERPIILEQLLAIGVIVKMEVVVTPGFKAKTECSYYVCTGIKFIHIPYKKWIQNN